MTPTLIVLNPIAYALRAWRDGVRVPALAYQLGDKIVTCAPTPKRLAHEWLHWCEPALEHEPVLACDVFSYNPLRLTDKHQAMQRSAPWRQSVGYP